MSMFQLNQFEKKITLDQLPTAFDWQHKYINTDNLIWNIILWMIVYI